MGNKRVPELRFAGFTGEWERNRLKDLVEFFNEKRIPVDSGKRIKGQYPYYGATGIIDYVEGYIFEGEYVLLAEDGANIITRNSPVAYLTKGKFWVNNHAHIMRMKSGSNIYLVQMLERQNYEKYNSGTAQPKLNAKVVRNIILNIPSKKEQMKIGNFFKQLDDTIALHQQELDILKQTKQGFLQKMFPKEGKSVPELRFPGFTGKWKKRKLGEMADVIGGGTPNTKTPEYWNGNIDWYSPVEIGEDTYAVGSQRKITELGLKKSSAKMLPANKTILFTSRAGIGDMAILKKDGATNQGFQSLVVNEDYDIYFVYSMGNKIKEFALRYATGSTFLEISGKELSKMILSTPSLKEQTKIGNFFKQLDDTIALQEKELETLKQTKKAFLQKMFV